MSGVFVDSSGWIAVAEDSERSHAEAVRYYRQLTASRVPVWTTNYVVAETVTWLRYHIHHRRAVLFWGTIEAASRLGRLTVEWITPERHEQAWRIFRDHADQRLSLVDCTSFVVARQVETNAVFTFDRDFQTMGFTTEPGVG